MPVEISFIITVFNKAKYIGNSLASLFRAAKGFDCEYIFVDDASTDTSVEIIEKQFVGRDDSYKVIKAQKNRGPSISLNIGDKAAAGKYLFLIDGDDLLVSNGLSAMLNAIKKHDADFVFGGHRFFWGNEAEAATATIPHAPHYKVDTATLDRVLNGKYVRMSYLTTKKIFLEAGGADERIFIQDESLPLRLAKTAQKMISFFDPCVLALDCENSLSKNINRQHHDRFYAYYYALKDFTDITDEQRLNLYKRAISCVWKAKRQEGGMFAKKLPVFLAYVRARYSRKFLPVTMKARLEKYRSFIDKLN